MKIVINITIGGFYVDNPTLARLRDIGLKEAHAVYDLMWSMDKDDLECMIELNHYDLSDVNRTDPKLIQVVEEQKSMDNLEHLAIINIPDDVDFYVQENEMGIESVHEKHRVWQFTLDGE